MAKNRNPGNRNNEERTGSNQGNIERNEQPGRKAADRGNESSRQGSSERDSNRNQPNREQGGERDAGSSRSGSSREASGRESGRQGSNNPEQGRQARETEGLDVDQLDEERENI